MSGGHVNSSSSSSSDCETAEIYYPRQHHRQDTSPLARWEQRAGGTFLSLKPYTTRVIDDKWMSSNDPRLRPILQQNKVPGPISFPPRGAVLPAPWVWVGYTRPKSFRFWWIRLASLLPYPSFLADR